MQRKPRVLFIGKFGVWRPALYGGEQRSERLATRLARAVDLTYACTGELTDDSASKDWAEKSNINRLVVCQPPRYPRAGRWGNIAQTVGALLPSEVPCDVSDVVSDSLVSALRSLSSSVDVAWAHRVWHAEAARRAGIRQVVCDIDDFEFVIAQQAYDQLYPFRRAPLHRILNMKLETYERRLGTRFSQIVVTKDQDLDLLDRRFRQKYNVVPNGFDVPSGVEPQASSQPRLFFVGNLRYIPNIDAVEWLMRDILPLIRRVVPSVAVTIAGRGPAPAAIVNLTSNGEAEVIESPESLDPLYARAAVVVAPIRLGHGTRIKVLEAASHGRAMVATTEALKGHPLEHEKHLLVADTTADFASACIRLLQSQNDQLRLALEARKKAMMLGGWDRSAALALEVINKTIEG